MTNYTEEYTENCRELLRCKLNKCTDEQIHMFNRMYVSIDKITSDKMKRAYEQICLTVERNCNEQAT